MMKKTELRIKGLRPMFNRVLTTAARYDGGGGKGALKEYQRVLAVGDSVKGVAKDDVVCINPTRYLRAKHTPGSLRDGVIDDSVSRQYSIPAVEVDGTECLLVYDADVEYVVTSFEEVETDTGLILPGDQGIMV